MIAATSSIQPIIIQTILPPSDDSISVIRLMGKPPVVAQFVVKKDCRMPWRIDSRGKAVCRNISFFQQKCRKNTPFPNYYIIAGCVAQGKYLARSCDRYIKKIYPQYTIVIKPAARIFGYFTKVKIFLQTCLTNATYYAILIVMFFDTISEFPCESAKNVIAGRFGNDIYPLYSRV